ncbi:metal ABC transporter ATP-binding protein [Marinomonas ostreistagni]|uniref:metal ABC transporter ATP-binding protein n=1 Tax=Marinomonas ostreistagni TaxID=359209 RepID=UPI00194E7CB5|nr:metal ABC transporter ATP-binding protein [Marinomonas ostreistagni]MBM6550961.1 metal ABC transporter ATP-binding protein [Marinomonas ostreistagni]
MMGPSLYLANVNVTVKGMPLLESLDLNLDGGQWHGIAGPNGGGKSTLLKAIAGLHNHSGSIKLHWPEGRNHAGYMPQLSPFDASLPVTALDFLRMHCDKRPVWRRFKGDPKIDAVVERVGINKLLGKRLGTLSSGERQRVLLSCALLNEPHILLLDEPLAGVDKHGREQILEILVQFKANGGTIVMIEHDWQILQAHCDTLSWIDGGLQGHDDPTTLLQSFQSLHIGLRHAS